VEVVLVVVLMFTPVDRSELKEAEPALGRVAAEARGAALQGVGVIFAVLLRNTGERLGRKRLLGSLGARVRVRHVGRQ
jgi:hypothetical protein